MHFLRSSAFLHSLVWSTWLAVATVLLLLATCSIDSSAELIFSAGAVVVLILLRRFELKDTWRLFFLFVACYLSLRYFYWRVTTTIVYHGPVSFAAAIALFIAELYGIIIYLLGIFVNISPLDRQPIELPQETECWPTVDVLIPSYNEPEDLLEVTLLAASRIDYPKDKLHVYLLDDGGTVQKRNDPDRAKAAQAIKRHASLQTLCEGVDAYYLTREQNDHAKAGNLNAGLGKTHSDLILILDADHVPTDILKQTVGWFLRDPKMFLVQTPHFFLNPDPIEKNLGTFENMPSENELFYQVIQKGLDFWNSSFFCGSAAVLRRTLLNEVGGLSGITITEDAETALGLHAKGYHSAYIARPMISGLSPETFGGFIVQRMRWAQGMVQIFLLKNPLTLRGLSLWQRLCYLSSCMFWFFSYARLVFLLAPSALLLFNLRIYDAQPLDFVSYTMPHMFAVIFVSDYLYGKVRWNFVSELYELMQSCYCLPAIFRVFLNPYAPTFQVTPKGEQLNQDFVSPLSRPFYIFFILTFLSVLVGFWKVIFVPSELYAVSVSLGWGLFNLILLLAAIGALFERRQRRATPRLSIKGEVVELILSTGEHLLGILNDVSMGGAGVYIDTAVAKKYHWEVGQKPELSLGDQLPDMKTRVQIRNVRAQEDGKTLVGLKFVHTTFNELLNKVTFVAGRSGRWIDFQMRREQRVGIYQSLFFLIRIGVQYSYQHGWMLLQNSTTKLFAFLIQPFRPQPTRRRRRPAFTSSATSNS